MTDESYKILDQQKFEESDLPPILYKYREWDKPQHKTILTENIVYLSPPKEFKDEFDCKIPIRYDLLTDKEIYEKYLNASKIANPQLVRQEHSEYARNCLKKGLMRDKKRLEEHDQVFFESFNKRFGVLCLTPEKDNLKMWDDYANHHTGFCVGFHTIPLFKLSQYFGSGQNVNYFDALPIIKETYPLEKKHLLQIYSKLRKWEFENEYRLTKFNVLNRQAKVPSEIYAEIILGAKMETEDKNELLEIIKRKFPHVKIFQAQLNRNNVTLINIQP